MHLLIGTSGWLYEHWNGKFYPEGMKDRDKLKFLSEHFHTVEINSTFYHMPPGKTFQHWHDVAGEKFLYSVKFSRYITRTKRLVLDDESKPFIREFLKRTRFICDKLGAVIIQLPPGLKFDLELLEKFLKYFTGYLKRIKLNADVAIEFRNRSWFEQETYNILRKYNTAFVCADSSRYPCEKIVTADFMYFRLHGPRELFASKYTDDELNQWHEFIKANDKLRRCYVYFNNDFYGYAIENAEYLLHLVSK
jgi:uncharacterized protein YecE (DUF72 family)